VTTPDQHSRLQLQPAPLIRKNAQQKLQEYLDRVRSARLFRFRHEYDFSDEVHVSLHVGLRPCPVVIDSCAPPARLFAV